MTEGKRNIIQQLLQEYDIETAEDIQDALKDLLGLIQCDETGTRVDGKTWWVHNASDALFTFLSINQKRGWLDMNDAGTFRNFMESRYMTVGAPIGSTQITYMLSAVPIYCVN